MSWNDIAQIIFSMLCHGEEGNADQNWRRAFHSLLQHFGLTIEQAALLIVKHQGDWGDCSRGPFETEEWIRRQLQEPK
jgi:hypothetical protein